MLLDKTELESRYNECKKLMEDVISDKSIRDFVKEEYINKEWTICPPEKPNGKWTWSKDSYVKPGEDACQLSDILSSIGIQEILLNTTTDVVCVASLTGWNDLIFYIKLPQDIVDAIKAMPEKYYNYKGKILPASKLKTFAEGDYIAFGSMSSGSCKKESISRNLQKKFGNFDEDAAIKIMVGKFTGEYYLKDLYGDTKKSIEQIGKMFYQFVMDNQALQTIQDILFLASDLWYESLENEKIAKQKKEDEAKAKKEAIKQSYIDWVEEGNPTYMREGFTYRGAKATPIDVDDAVVRIQSDQPFEYNWEIINGEKALVLQYYSESDMW